MTVPTTANMIPAAESPTTIAANEDRIPGEFLGFWRAGRRASSTARA